MPLWREWGTASSPTRRGFEIPGSPGILSYIQNAGLMWVVILVGLSVAAWFGMNNITTEWVSPHIGSTAGALLKTLSLLPVGLVCAAAGLFLLLGLGLLKWLVLPLVIAATLLVLLLLPGGLQDELRHQFAIFDNKHTWVMTIIYTMTFGSFIGFSAAFPLSIKVIFGFVHDASGADVGINPNGEQVKAGTPEKALWGFAAFYFLCLILNWWDYARRRAEIQC